MSKILQITPDSVTIGLSNGGIKDVPLAAINFPPKIGMEVEVYEDQNRLIVTPTPSSAAAFEFVPEGKKKVNKIAYCLLAFFLGGIGVHKFYAGHMMLGIIYLLFCWTLIPGLIALIELIIAICKPADANGMIVA